jgi:FtsP/CotA-like multicopper oxidase with cupredoxin domain
MNGRGCSPDDPPVVLHPGGRYRFACESQTDEAHPRHYHRSRFELASVNGRQTSGVFRDVTVAKTFEALK